MRRFLFLIFIGLSTLFLLLGGVLWIGTARLPDNFRALLAHHGIGFSYEKTDRVGNFAWVFHNVHLNQFFAKQISLEIDMPSYRLLPVVELRIDELDISKTPIASSIVAGSYGSTDHLTALALSQLPWTIRITETEVPNWELKRFSGEFFISRLSSNFRVSCRHVRFGNLNLNGNLVATKNGLEIADSLLTLDKFSQYGFSEVRLNGNCIFSSGNWEVTASNPQTSSKMLATGKRIGKLDQVKYDVRDLDLVKLVANQQKFPVGGLVSGEALQRGNEIEGNVKVKNFELKSVSFTELVKKELQKSIRLMPSNANIIKSEKWDAVNSAFQVEKNGLRLSSFVAKRRELEIQAANVFIGFDGNLNGKVVCFPNLSLLPSPLGQILFSTLGGNVAIPAELSGSVKTPLLIADKAALSALGQKLKVGILGTFLKKTN